MHAFKKYFFAKMNLKEHLFIRLHVFRVYLLEYIDVEYVCEELIFVSVHSGKWMIQESLFSLI